MNSPGSGSPTPRTRTQPRRNFPLGRSTYRSRTLISGMAALLVGSGLPVWAQDPPGPETAAQHWADTDAQEAATGAERRLRFDMGANLSYAWDDNIYATPDGTVSSYVTTISPWFSLASDLERHALGLSAQLESAYFSEENDEDYTDYSIRLDGRYDLTDRHNLFGSLTHLRLHEDRTAVDLPEAALEPTRYSETRGVTGAALGFERSELRMGLTVRNLRFDDVPLTGGGTLRNDDRDRNQYEFGGRLTRLGEAAWQPFMQAAVDQRRYRRSEDDFGFRRDSDGTSLAIGMTREIGPGYAEVFIGHMQQSYDDPRFDTISTWDAGARLEALLTPRTAIRVQADRSIEETTLVGVPGSIDTVARVTLEHRITPRLTAQLPAYWIRSEFQQSDRRDDVTGSGMSLAYRLTGHLNLIAGHTYQRRDSSNPEATYDNAITFVGLDAALTDSPLRPIPPGNPGNGWYAGVHAGHNLLGTEVSGPRGAPSGGGSIEGEFGDSTLLGGGFLGHAWRIDRWLVALEAELDEGGGSWDHDRRPAGRTFSLERGTGLAGSARLGYRFGPAALLYGRAGLAVTEFTADYGEGQDSLRTRDSRRGVRLGLGAEVALDRHWFGRLDWSHTGYHGYDVDTPTGTDHFAPEEITLRLGLGYRFQEGPDPRAPMSAPDAFAGPYLGARLGYGWLHTDNAGEDRGQDGSGTLRVGRAGGDVQGGVFGGYGFRRGALYLGLEVELEESQANWDSERSPQRRIYSASRGQAYGAGVRAGYIVNETLLYGRIGHVRSDFDTRYRFAGEGVDIDDKRTLTGLRTGFGVEFPAAESLFVRLDYTYTDFDSYRIRYTTSTTTDAVENFDHGESALQIGLGYRF